MVVANITDVENQLLTSDGRVFVTGSKNIYEVLLLLCLIITVVTKELFTAITWLMFVFILYFCQ